MKRLATMLGCVLFLGLGVTACDDGDPPEEDGGTPQVDSGPEATAVVGVGEDLDTLSPADYSCVGMNTAPTAGGDVNFTGVVEDFFNGDPVEDLTVQFFPNNMASLDGTCTGDCVELTSGADGSVALTAGEGGWYAYRVVAGEGLQAGTPADYIEAVQSNVTVPSAGSTENLIAVQSSTRDTIITLLGVTAEDGTATITGAVYDCNGDAVANADVRMFDSSGEIELGFARTGPREFYFDGDSFPRGAQRATNVDGLYGAANVPIPSDNVVRVEIWGSLADGEAPQLLGCETTQAIADGITIINIDPLRSDAPAGCGG